MIHIGDTTEEVALKIGLRIAEHRKAMRLSQADLASRAGTSLRTIVRMENGEANPGLSVFIRICEVLGRLEAFNQLLPEMGMSPRDILQSTKLPKRVRKHTVVKDWKWGDEQ